MPVVGSALSSPTTNTSGWPLTPPCEFFHATQVRSAAAAGAQSAPSTPENGPMVPILIGDLFATVGACATGAAAAAPDGALAVATAPAALVPDFLPEAVLAGAAAAVVSAGAVVPGSMPA